MPEVRVAARHVDFNALEFAIQLRDADGEWQDRILPRRRFIAASVEAGRWLHSTPTSVADGAREVRAVARRLESGWVEFALQVRAGDGDWSDRLLPRARFMPPDSTVGRWLVSSEVDIQ